MVRLITPPTADFLKAEIARGAFELIGGGYLLWIADIVVSAIRAAPRR